MAKITSTGLKQYSLALVVIWTAGIIASLGWTIYELKQSILTIARTTAEISYDKDILYRKWVSNQGGVYVPVSEMTLPNPYLKVPNRDVTASNGLSLTLVNPAYMTRQVNELATGISNFHGHITSLNPIRPENYADIWETEALKTFERGTKETVAIEMSSGKEYFRFMRPFVTEKACLKCHAAQGYKEGDIRGGLSISIPMEPLRAIERKRIVELTIAHSFLWMIGLVGIVIVTQRLRSQTLQREKIEKELLTLSITDLLTDLHNRRGFLSLAEQQLKAANRAKRQMMLAFIDVDGMKWINDTLGHEEGDNALIDTATILRQTFRESDIIARMGGDEFAVLAIDMTDLNPEVLSKRLQQNIDGWNAKESRPFKIAMSWGTAIYDPGSPMSLNQLMSEADELMYTQKKAKVNRRI